MTLSITGAHGRAITQAVSSLSPTAEARVRSQVKYFGIYDGLSDTEAGLLRVLRVPFQFSFHQTLHTHHLSSGAGTIGQLVADMPSGLSLTPNHETKNKNWDTYSV
jgi:hypothetical protein